MFTIMSLNVNGIRAAVNNGLDSILSKMPFDCICLQETKLQNGMIMPLLSNYYSFWAYCTIRNGYAGTAILTKHKPLSINYGIGNAVFDCEGRSITVEYEKYFIVNVYVPTARDMLSRLDYRLHWDQTLINYLTSIKSQKPVIVCGDFNVALTDVDVFSPILARNSAGFTDSEKRSFQSIIELGFIDGWRYKHPKEQRFTWWSYCGDSRHQNHGWRIDYILVQSELKTTVAGCDIFDNICVSDHCPVILALNY